MLREHGTDWPSVIKLIYLRDLGALHEMVAASVPVPRPAATLVEVSGFVDPRSTMEIDAVADLGTR